MSLRTFTTALTAFTALTTAIPHALSHSKLHSRALDMALPLAARDVQISPLGVCGGDSGFGCAPGDCCSQYGYCGSAAEYCGGDDKADLTQSKSQDVQPAAYESPSQQQEEAAAPAATSAAPAPAPAQGGNDGSSSSDAGSSSDSGPDSYSGSSDSGSSSGSTNAGSNSYTMYTGDGSTGAGWPAESDWVDFESMWNANLDIMSSSCANSFGESDNTDDEIAMIKDAIKSVCSSAGIDERFTLAVMLQESKGCVRAPTTTYSHSNPGLMQSHDGSGTCAGSSSCGSSEIRQMIADGTTGTSSGSGLEQLMQQCDSTGAQLYYEAARMYNSGSVAASGLLEDGVATHCYASDIANRLTGWTTAETACTLD